jgi:two-component system cell cycle sensor histidine kinase/response regulator CckA
MTRVSQGKVKIVSDRALSGDIPRYTDSASAATAGTGARIRLLHLEDSAKDAELIKDRLEVGGINSEITRVNSRLTFESALEAAAFDIILCDFNLPDYDGLSALSAARDKQPNVPVIVISGSLREEEAAKCLRLGATDYLLKKRLERLPNAVRRAITGAEELRMRHTAEAELRASEERFRLLARYSKDVFWFVGLNPERVLYVSPAVETIWGLSAKSLYDDASIWWSSIHAEDKVRVRAAWDACANGSSAHFEEEYRVSHVDGSVRLVANSGSIFLDDVSGNAHMSGLVRDITERTRMEGELRQAQKMEGIGQLAGGIAHDFNNLLTVIQGNSDLALGDLDPSSPSYADIGEIKRAAVSAAALTRQLLAFSRRQVLLPRPIELRAVPFAIESMLSRLLGDNIELVLELDSECGFVLADPGQIEQVIVNLAVNARDAMPDGGRITIKTQTVQHHEKTSDWIAGQANGVCESLTVTDTGIGMDRMTRERIFEPFYTTKGPGRGTGLGLSTVHGIVKQSGGELHLSSIQGFGTTFTIYFPHVTKATPADITPASSRSVAGSETILVVEDQTSLRELVGRVLKQKGYRVLEARDGDEGVRVASESKEPIHLIITDVVMPGLNARVMVDRISLRWPGVQVLFMSGYHDDDVMLRKLANAEVDFLQKPFLPYDLAEKVRAVLERVQ